MSGQPALTSFWIALLTIFATTPALAHTNTFGGAEIGVVRSDGKWLYVMRYRFITPFFPISDVWVRLDLRTTSNTDTHAQPVNISCALMVDQKPQTGHEYAQYEGGSLYLYFEELKPDTDVQFLLGWKYPHGSRVRPYDARIKIKARGWVIKDQWEMKDSKDFNPSKPVQIAITDEEYCSFF